MKIVIGLSPIDAYTIQAMKVIADANVIYFTSKKDSDEGLTEDESKAFEDWVDRQKLFDRIQTLIDNEVAIAETRFKWPLDEEQLRVFADLENGYENWEHIGGDTSKQTVKRKDKSRREKAPTYLKITCAILVISTVLTMAASRQRQKDYEKLTMIVESYCEATDDFCESSERVINSTEKLKQSIDTIKELIQ